MNGIRKVEVSHRGVSAETATVRTAPGTSVSRRRGAFVEFPRRRARVGAIRVDVIVMILMILAVLGAVAAAVFTYEAWRKDERTIARMREVADLHGAEWSTLSKASVAACEPLGFRSVDGGLSNKEAISQLFLRAAAHSPTYAKLSSDIDPESYKATDKKLKPKSDGAKPSMNGVGRESEKYAKDANNDIKTLISDQDRQINNFLLQLNRFAGVRSKEVGAESDSAKSFDAKVRTESSGVRAEIQNTDTSLRNAGQAQESDEARETASIADVQDVLTKAYDDVDVAARGVEEERRKLRAAVRGANAARERLVDIYADRVRSRAEIEDFDGFVTLVDEVSGWVWISLGQAKDVRPEMVFEVRRAIPGRVDTRSIGSIRVKEVLSQRMSRCRIDVLDEGATLPRGGDLIRDKTFSTQQYRRFAFLGKFGSPHSTYSRQQLADILYRFDKIVLDEPDDTVEVIVLGADWRDDLHFQKLKNFKDLNAEEQETARQANPMAELRVSLDFETMLERDLLYMFGLAGPGVVDDLAGSNVKLTEPPRRSGERGREKPDEGARRR